MLTSVSFVFVLRDLERLAARENKNGDTIVSMLNEECSAVETEPKLPERNAELLFHAKVSHSCSLPCIK